MLFRSGASGINDLVLQALPALLKVSPDLQFIHLTGPSDVAKVLSGYDAFKARAVVRPFLTEMELALGAANVSVSRAGGSSLAELAAMRLPSVLIPYPTAADNHQLHNARAYADTGAAFVLEQKGATSEALASLVLHVLADKPTHTAMANALDQWHHANAAELIAERMIALMEAMKGKNSKSQAPSSKEIPNSKLQAANIAHRIGTEPRPLNTIFGSWNLDLGPWNFVVPRGGVS